MNRTIIRTFVTLALLLSISEVASGGTVRVSKLLNGAVSGAMLGEVGQDIDLSKGICTITVAPVTPYIVEGVTAVKVTDGGNAQSRRLRAPVVSTPIEVARGEGENSWLFQMPSEEYDVEVAVYFAIPVTERYPIWVKGIQVNNVNKDNVLGGGEVRFNPTTGTLSFYNAYIVAEDTTAVVRTSLPQLDVELHGNSFLTFNRGFIHEGSGADASLTFTTSTDAPGQLGWQSATATSQPLFSAGFNVACAAPLRPFDVCEPEKFISVAAETAYGLMVGTRQVTNRNCTDILGDGQKKVVYLPNVHTLVLNDVRLTQPITSSLATGLNIYLLGKSSIRGAKDLIASTVPSALLVFTTKANAPGRLTLTKTDDEGTWITGFAATSVPDDYATTPDGNTLTIAHPVPITPIVTETENGEKPENEVPTGDFGQAVDGLDPDTYVNIVVNNVLYTLKAGDYNEGTSGNPDDPSGVNLSEIPASMSDVLNNMPGTDAYANAFKGITIEVPKGTGEILVTGEIGTGAILAVQIGDSAPVLFPNALYPEYNKLETIRVPYYCPKNTFVYIYLFQSSASATARSESPFRGRVLSGHIKVNNVGASSSSMVTDNSYSSQDNVVMNRVTLYSLPANAITADGRGVHLSTVSLQSARPASRQFREPASDDETTQKITDLSPTLFDTMDKDKILYIDLSGTDIKDFTVNRSSGLMSGFTSNALVYLPDGNDDGGENNVVVGDNCNRLSLDDGCDFRAPNSFHASNATMLRAFKPSRASTLFLPFSLSATQAAALGKFHQFKEVKGSQAVFSDAETGDIPANTPHIFVPATEVLNVSDVSVKGKNASSATSANLTGTYERLEWTTDQTDVYSLSAATEGSDAVGDFARVNAGDWISPFSAYLKVSAAPASLAIVIGDNPATAIVDHGTVQEETVWHTVDGRILSGKPTRKGMYINNGQIVVVR